MKTREKLLKMKSFLGSITKPGDKTMESVTKGFALCFNNFIFESMNEEAIKMKIDWSNYPDPMIQGGIKLMHEINGLEPGAESHITGGAVRDIVAEIVEKKVNKDNSKPNVSPHDIDIATNVDEETLKRHFAGKIDQSTGGATHGTYLIRFVGTMYEVTLYRHEGEYTDKRRPDFVEFIKSFKEDTARRDLRINAMGIDVSGNVIDYWGGVADIHEKLIRTVGTPVDRFSEDPIRMLRAIRFASKQGFRIEDTTYAAIKKNHKLFGRDPKPEVNLVRGELVKIMSEYGAEKFALALDMLRDTGLFPYILPEVDLTDEKIIQTKRANTMEPSVFFAILLDGFSEEAVDSLKARFRFDNDTSDFIHHARENLKEYRLLGKLNRRQGLKLVTNKFFSRLRALYIALHGTDIENADAVVNNVVRFAKADARQPEISKIMQNRQVPMGPLYGKIKSEATSWLFSKFEEGNEPSPDELARYVDNLIREMVK
jgi:tRNA nucleotidyltransferase/poly(A) polymerase